MIVINVCKLIQSGFVVFDLSFTIIYPIYSASGTTKGAQIHILYQITSNSHISMTILVHIDKSVVPIIIHNASQIPFNFFKSLKMPRYIKSSKMASIRYDKMPILICIDTQFLTELTQNTQYTTAVIIILYRSKDPKYFVGRCQTVLNGTRSVGSGAIGCQRVLDSAWQYTTVFSYRSFDAKGCPRVPK